jgi:DNA polymerase/3'-5' exonuclease PolX
LKLKNYIISGSYRRGKWWCNDIDLLVPVQSKSEEEGLKELMKKMGWRLHPFGSKASDVVFREQFIKKFGKKYIVLDLFLCPPGSWGNALLFTTGSTIHNDIIRASLKKRKYTWENPRYFTHLETGKKLSFSDEKQVMSWLGIKWLRPRKRL